MLIADGGGGYSGTTDWFSKDVPAMWALLEQQETTNYYRNVEGWKKACELTAEHLWRLEKYRDNLAAAWPPEKSTASRAFVDRLNKLIAHVKETYEVAVGNHRALSTASSAIYTSRSDLKKIYDEYLKKRQQKQEYDDRVEAEKASLLPGVSLGDPPVTDAELEQLRSRARSIMYSLSSSLVEAKMQIRQPTPYTPPSGMVGGDKSDPYGSGTSAPPPSIPPIAPIPGAGPSAPVSHAPSTAPTQVVVTPPPPTVGPVLGGAGPVVTPPPAVAPPAPPVITPSPVPAPGVVLPPTMPVGPGRLPAAKIGAPSPTTSPPNAGAMGPGAGALTKPGAGGVAGGAPRAMPPGGVIGGSPGAALGQPGAPGQSARRIHPVGGVIGNQRPSVGLGGTVQPATAQPFSPHAARPGQGRNDDERAQRWDPNNPWETDEGVTPVVLPSRETGRIDPGPAIGFDR